MEDIKIAGVHTVKQWKELEQTLNNREDVCWEYAFRFFEERIETRYLEPIEAILNIGNNKGEGFAVVNLQCSLIETIESFIQGWVYNATKTVDKKGNTWYSEDKIVIYKNDEELKNLNIFVSFFDNREPFNIKFEENNLQGDDFYWNVRCALLHETQTKNNWKIKKSIDDKNAFEVKGGFKILYRENFHRDIKEVIKNYKSAIVEGEKFDGIEGNKLRQNFRDKFNHICNQS